MKQKINGVRMILSEWKSIDEDSSFESFYLYWLEAKDLGDLDRRIMRGEYSDSDFEDAVICEFHTHESCSKCLKQWPVLGIDVVFPYAGNLALKRHKQEMVRKKNAKLRCPSCNGEFLEIIVVKIFESSNV